MNIESSAFGPGQPIPKKFTGEGEDVSPPLSWKNVPAGTCATIKTPKGMGSLAPIKS